MGRASKAFANRVVRRFHTLLVRYLASRLRCPDDANDLAQKVYLSLLNVNPRSVKDPLKYLLKCANAAVADFYATKQSEPVQFDGQLADQTAESPSTAFHDNPIEGLDLERDVTRVLKRLRLTHRRVFVMIAWDGKTYASVASELGYAVDTVKTYFFEAAVEVRAAIKGGQGVHEP
jgi:RNA polymerase sigma-19 factor, ECF subfamily